MPVKPPSLVPLVCVQDMMELVLDTGVECLPASLADCIKGDFRRWELFDKKPFIACHSPEGVIELMPESDGVTHGFKYAHGHPRNICDGHQPVTAFCVLADVDTDYLAPLREITLLTGLRTAAMSVAAEYLASKNSYTDERQVTLFESVGFAIQDFSALPYVHDRIRESAHFISRGFVADSGEPQERYGMLLRAAV